MSFTLFKILFSGRINPPHLSMTRMPNALVDEINNLFEKRHFEITCVVGRVQPRGWLTAAFKAYLKVITFANRWSPFPFPVDFVGKQLKVYMLLYWLFRRIKGELADVIVLFPGIWLGKLVRPNIISTSFEFSDKIALAVFLQKMMLVGIRINKKPIAVTPWFGPLLMTTDAPILSIGGFSLQNAMLGAMNANLQSQVNLGEISQDEMDAKLEAAQKSIDSFASSIGSATAAGPSVVGPNPTDFGSLTTQIMNNPKIAAMMGAMISLIHSLIAPPIGGSSDCLPEDPNLDGNNLKECGLIARKKIRVFKIVAQVYDPINILQFTIAYQAIRITGYGGEVNGWFVNKDTFEKFDFKYLRDFEYIPKSNTILGFGGSSAPNNFKYPDYPTSEEFPQNISVLNLERLTGEEKNDFEVMKVFASFLKREQNLNITTINDYRTENKERTRDIGDFKIYNPATFDKDESNAEIDSRFPYYRKFEYKLVDNPYTKVSNTVMLNAGLFQYKNPGYKVDKDFIDLRKNILLDNQRFHGELIAFPIKLNYGTNTYSNNKTIIYLLVKIKDNEKVNGFYFTDKHLPLDSEDLNKDFYEIRQYEKVSFTKFTQNLFDEKTGETNYDAFRRYYTVVVDLANERYGYGIDTSKDLKEIIDYISENNLGGIFVEFHDEAVKNIINKDVTYIIQGNLISKDLEADNDKLMRLIASKFIPSTLSREQSTQLDPSQVPEYTYYAPPQYKIRTSEYVDPIKNKLLIKDKKYMDTIDIFNLFDFDNKLYDQMLQKALQSSTKGDNVYQIFS